MHTSDDLMRELTKVVEVVRRRSELPVYTVLVIDATTGQNGLQQAREFNKALDLDGIIVTKLDGTAKGGISVAIAHELELPLYKIGVGEGIEDLQDFDALDCERSDWRIARCWIIFQTNYNPSSRASARRESSTRMTSTPP